MRKLFMIARSNIRKNRSMSITLAALILFAAILLYIGISVMMEINTFIDDKNDELNGSDFSVISVKTYEDLVEKTIKGLGKCEKLETEDAFKIETGNIKNITKKEKKQSISFILFNADASGNISKLKIIDQGLKKYRNSIILPYFLKTAKGYKTGDKIIITDGNKKKSYVIYGFSEDVIFATPSNISMYKCYVFEDEFNRLYQNANGTAKSVLVKTKLKEGTDTDRYSAAFTKKINSKIKSTVGIAPLEYDSMKVGVGIFIFIIMAFLVVFSIIVLLIALTVMRFAIITYIEGNIKNIGSMEAMGYVGKQLMFSTILQFLFITIIGSGIGFIIAVSGSGLVKNVISSSIGLQWVSRFNSLALLLSFIIITFLVVLITYLASRKIRKITPIVALRSGIDTHNFKKNYFPLSRNPLNLNVVLGLKSFMQNMKQNITITFVVILMSFVCVFAFTVNYNFNFDDTAFIRLVGLEKTQLAVYYYKEDAMKVFKEIGEMKHVVKTSRLTDIGMTILFDKNEMTPMVHVCNDYNHLKIKTISEGRYPIHDNEIAVTGKVLNQLQAKLGDVVTLKANNIEKDFIVVGITQQISYLGKSASITEEGMKRINPEFRPNTLNLYLDSSKNIASVTKAIKNRYGENELEVMNLEKYFETIMASFNSAILVICIAGIIFTACIITLILYLFIKIKLLKEKVHIGTAKALGYTTKQLVFQVIVSFCPVCILGAGIGTILAMIFINPAFAACLSFSGISNSNLTISPITVVSTFLAISIYSMIITAIVSMKIRKITPCELFL